jgi:hypothetical protein
MGAYADTGFLVSLYTQDSNTAQASTLILERRTPLLVTPFGEAEFVNTIELRVFRKEITPAQADKSSRAFHADLAPAGFLLGQPVPPSAYERATLLSRQNTRHIGTRAMDVLHVAIALELHASGFFTFHRSQAKLAKLAGLPIRPAR